MAGAACEEQCSQNTQLLCSSTASSSVSFILAGTSSKTNSLRTRGMLHGRWGSEDRSISRHGQNAGAVAKRGMPLVFHKGLLPHDAASNDCSVQVIRQNSLDQGPTLPPPASWITTALGGGISDNSCGILSGLKDFSTSLGRFKYEGFSAISPFYISISSLTATSELPSSTSSSEDALCLLRWWAVASWTLS